MPLQPPPAGSLRARILAGETLFGSFASGGSAIHAEILARAGFDWLIVDLEHGAGTESELMGQLHAIGDRTTAIVRPQSAERPRIGRPGTRAAVAGAVIDDAGRASGIAELLREVAPHLDAAQPLVQEDQGRALEPVGLARHQAAHAQAAVAEVQEFVGLCHRFRCSRRQAS